MSEGVELSDENVARDCDRMSYVTFRPPIRTEK